MKKNTKICQNNLYDIKSTVITGCLILLIYFWAIVYKIFTDLVCGLLNPGLLITQQLGLSIFDPTVR